ncbi:MAG: acetate--CoA ligase family protein, partial [Actinomycetota bacterium]|nr:acetate--CoA ligase family protein [Actinomycetota bacterium]
MDIHEYQAKELLRGYGVPIPPGEVVYSERAAARVAEEVGGSRWVVKAQIHAGGRGRAGGVKIANSPQKVAELADLMIGSILVTPQTGPEGKRVQRVLVERASRIEREFYLSMIVDRVSQRIVVMASAQGGVEIEEVAAHSPE